MPTYEYECQQCHERVEAVQKFSDPTLSVCPLCGGELRKIFSAVGIVFKGSGFYKNDSRGSVPKTTTTPSTTTDTEKSAVTPAATPTPSSAPAPSSS
ncbi:MAG TPA: FmdB family zinc ribbon protein [Acidimicrobiales bacterium]|nr:FmdB family zinc ribbon protein [Acidimicrobiales bacterium]